MQQSLLVVNVGSSSVKLAAFDANGAKRVALRRLQLEFDPARDAPASLGQRIVEGAERLGAGLGVEHWQFVAHRVVSGGTCHGPARECDAQVLDALRAAARLAPLHGPWALAAIEAMTRMPSPPQAQVAVFDSGFFDGLPETARRVALPRAVVEEFGLWRRGYHGLAHQALWRHASARLGPDATRRVVTLQLGSGASIAAIGEGVPLDVSMGFSPLEGLVMNTRCGDLDPGILLALLDGGRHDVGSLTRLLYRESGLLGLSGRSGDLRELIGSDEPDARLAVEAYCQRAKRHVGACLALLGGVDAVVVGGGVGEHQPKIRERVLGGLEFAGIQLDLDANARALGGDADIGPQPGHSRPGAGRARVLVAAVDEASEIATTALRLLAKREAPS